jgi:hypothetical protein
MNTWDHLTARAHELLTRPRRGDLTPAVTLIQSLHKQPPQTPNAICAHLDTATTVLPRLAGYARHGDRHALLMAAVLMRHPLRHIAEIADPDGYRSTAADARDNDTLAIFFTLIRTAAEPQILTARYLYGQTLKRVLAARPRPGAPAAALRLDPHEMSAKLTDRSDADGSEADGRTTQLLRRARDNKVITALEHDTLKALYLHTGTYNLPATALALGANAGAVERRAQRAIRKLVAHHTQTAAAA